MSNIKRAHEIKSWRNYLMHIIILSFWIPSAAKTYRYHLTLGIILAFWALFGIMYLINGYGL